MSLVKKTNKKNVFLFSFFDVANTVYSQIIQSTIILRYIQIIGQKEYGMTYDGATFFFTTVQALSQILVIALIPLFGAMMDRMGKRKPWVISITALTLVTSSLLWIKKDLAVVMTLFILANLSYWAALSAYDSMIPTLAAEKDIGKTSGFAMGLGWVSIIPAIGLLLLMNYIYSPLGEPNADSAAHVINGNTWFGAINYGYYGEWLTYVAAAVLFLLFMIPFFFTKEKTRPKEKIKFKQLLGDSFGQLYRTFRDIRQHKNMFLFIIGFFFIVDVANTANLIILNILRDGIGFPESQSLILELPVVVLAIGIIPLIGWLGDKVGPKATAYAVGALYLVGLTCGFFAIWYGEKNIAPEFSLMFVLTFIMMISVGVGIGATWVVQRVMILKLAPPDKVGEYVGFSYITGRLNASVALLLWGGLITLFYDYFNAQNKPWRTYAIALLFLIVLLIIGLIITFFVKLHSDEVRKKWDEEYLEKGMKTQTELEKSELAENISKNLESLT